MARGDVRRVAPPPRQHRLAKVLPLPDVVEDLGVDARDALDVPLGQEVEQVGPVAFFEKHLPSTHIHTQARTHTRRAPVASVGLAGGKAPWPAGRFFFVRVGGAPRAARRTGA